MKLPIETERSGDRPASHCTGLGRVVRTTVATGFFTLFASAAFGQGAHEHGIADLRVAIEGGEVLVEFDSPLDNLVGFEHAPNTPEQRAALAAAERRLLDFASLFTLPAAAGCVLSDVQLESPYPQGADGHGDHDHKHDHDHDHKHDHDHDHDHKHDHDHDHDHKHDHDHDHGNSDDHDHGHADLYVVYQLACTAPAALTEIRVGLMDAFPRIHTLRAETATPRGQGSLRMGPTVTVLPL